VLNSRQERRASRKAHETVDNYASSKVLLKRNKEGRGENIGGRTNAPKGQKMLKP